MNDGKLESGATAVELGDRSHKNKTPAPSAVQGALETRRLGGKCIAQGSSSRPIPPPSKSIGDDFSKALHQECGFYHAAVGFNTTDRAIVQ